MKKIESNTAHPLGGEECFREEPSYPGAKIAVSVVIPVYNTPEEILIPALEGILHQSLDNFELLVIDDGSDRP
ncbi:MAG: glycosyltransferase, partial [Thermoguttaceae bacterium]|nr:glycosyltransferase [Thermoguttaceae bacterium]